MPRSTINYETAIESLEHELCLLIDFHETAHDKAASAKNIANIANAVAALKEANNLIIKENE